jgi:hypothetical protein
MHHVEGRAMMHEHAGREPPWVEAHQQCPCPDDLHALLVAHHDHVDVELRRPMGASRRQELAHKLCLFQEACADHPGAVEAWYAAVGDTWGELLRDPDAHVCALAEECYRRVVRVLRPPPHLSDWFWDPFAQPDGLVLIPSDPQNHVRDALAALQVARRVPILPYGDVDFRFPDVGQSTSDWPDMPSGYPAALILGRIELYPPNVTGTLGAPPYWIDFVSDKERDAFHYRQIRTDREEPHVHAMVEDTDEHGRPICTDYAVVRRYTVEVEHRWVPVLQVGGTSSAGTYLGAVWATRRSSLRLPPEVDPQDSRLRLEALVKGTCYSGAPVWELVAPPECQHLYCDDYKWDGQCWTPIAPFVVVPRCITVVKRRGEVLDVLVDGEPAGLKRGTLLYRIFVRMCEVSAQHIKTCRQCGKWGRVVRECDAAWQSSDLFAACTRQPRQVRWSDRYNELRRRVVGSALQARDGQWRLVGIEVTIREEPDA